MTSPRRPVEIAILVDPPARLSAAYGLTDLFAVAMRLAGKEWPLHRLGWL